MLQPPAVFAPAMVLNVGMFEMCKKSFFYVVVILERSFPSGVEKD